MAKPTKDQEALIFNIFHAFYHKNITEETFIKELRRIEKRTKDGYKTIWFRFFNNDTGATTVHNIERDLNTLKNCYQNNRQYMLDKIEIAVTEDSLKINFS